MRKTNDKALAIAKGFYVNRAVQNSMSLLRTAREAKGALESNNIVHSLVSSNISVHTRGSVSTRVTRNRIIRCLTNAL